MRPALALIAGAVGLTVHFLAGDAFLSAVVMAGLAGAWWLERRAAPPAAEAVPEPSASTIEPPAPAQLESAQRDLVQLRRLLADAFTSLSGNFTSLEHDATQQHKALKNLINAVEGGDGITIGHFLRDNSESLAFFVELVMNISQQGVRTVQKIDDMTTQIDGAFLLLGQVEKIANQTNLLSINAMIESERAGESGRGFRVVAGEVKKLSQSTRSLSEQIRNQISSVRQATNDARTTVAQMASNDLNVFLENKARIDDMVTQLAQLDTRISSALHDVSEQSQRIEENVAGGVRALQFEDVGGQLVEHIQRVLQGQQKGESPAPLSSAPEAELFIPHKSVEQASMTAGATEIF